MHNNVAYIVENDGQRACFAGYILCAGDTGYRDNKIFKTSSLRELIAHDIKYVHRIKPAPCSGSVHIPYHTNNLGPKLE